MTSLGLRFKILTNGLMRRFGYQITKCAVPQPAAPGFPHDFDESDQALWKVVSPYTMTSPERVYSLERAVEYVVNAKLAGDIVECGVWKGGSAMAIAMTLLRAGEKTRQLYLYDTYDEGWPEGGPDDVMYDGTSAHELWLRALESGETPDTLFAKLNNVAEVMKSTGYPFDRVHMVKGKVEDTIPGVVPEEIALLRLDTDWYESTRHELEHLYPRLVSGGVLIIDDYGYFKGSRKAVDEYFAAQGIVLLLHRVDNSGYRIGIKR